MKRKKAPAGTLLSQLVTTYSALILFGFIGMTLFAGTQITATAWQNYKTELIYKATNLSHDLEGTVESYYREEIDDETLQEAITEVEGQDELDLEFYPVANPQLAAGLGRGDGQGLGRNQEDEIEQPSIPSEADDLKEFTDLERGEMGVYVRPDPITKQWSFITAVPVKSGPHIIGYLHYSVHAREIIGIFARSWAPLLGGLLLITLGVIFASRRIAAQITRPLEKLSQSSRQIAAGDLTARAAVEGPREIVSLASAFNQMASRVESMIDEQRAFASNASHELRTPLTALRLRAEALRDDTHLDDATKARYLTEIDDEVRRMSGLIEDLILLSRFDAGRAEIGQEDIEMGRFANSMIKQIEDHLREKQIGLTLTTDTDQEMIVTASINHLIVVFRNILDNAIKYTPDGGRISWTIKRSNNEIISTIEDNGSGIDPAVLPHLAERFYRGEVSHSREIPGSGLGLSLVQSIVNAYGGSLTVKSQGMNQGTLVTIGWPMKDELL